MTKKPAKQRDNVQWSYIGQLPENFYKIGKPGAVSDPNLALTIPSVFQALKIYQSKISSLPFLTYKKTTDGRERAKDLPEYNILNCRPNPAMPRTVFFRRLIYSMFFEGNFFGQIRRTTGGKLLGIYPIPSRAVVNIELDSNWNKRYTVQTGSAGKEVFPDNEMIHLFYFSKDGLSGCSFLEYAAENLGLHRAVVESALAYYQNAVRPGTYISTPEKLNNQTLATLKEGANVADKGTTNKGKLQILGGGAKLEKSPIDSAEDQQIISALNSSVRQIAQWFNLHPFLLGETDGAHYNAGAAENEAVWQKSIMPLATDIETEFNHKLFGDKEDLYCEFLAESILRGSVLEQAEIFRIYNPSGTFMEDNEIREKLNLPPLKEQRPNDPTQNQKQRDPNNGQGQSAA